MNMNTMTFVAQAIKSQKRRAVLCFDRADGRQLWQAGVMYAEAEPTQERNPYCSATLATNSVHEPTNASLAASDGGLFLRTDRALWCFTRAK